MGEASDRKVPKSFRLSQRVAELVSDAAKETGLSEAEVVEGCTINQARAIVAQYEHLKTAAAVSAVASAGLRRARAERSDKGSSK
jgi:hypothetical protein